MLALSETDTRSREEETSTLTSVPSAMRSTLAPEEKDAATFVQAYVTNVSRGSNDISNVGAGDSLGHRPL